MTADSFDFRDDESEMNGDNESMDDPELRKIIAELVLYAKEDHDYCVTLGNELAALRDALQELSGGKFLAILERHRKRMQETTTSLKLRDASQYDELIRRLSKT